MKAVLIFGMILVAVGIATLVYVASPVRGLMLAYAPEPETLTIPLAGAGMLACGVAILAVCRTPKR